jgi:transcriptional regulator with XRE-family HTH domain
VRAGDSLLVALLLFGFREVGMSLSDRLTELRKAKKVSLQVVADAVGVSKTHVYELEKGTASNPSLNLLVALADFYDVSLDYLAGYSNHQASTLGQLKAFVASDSVAMSYQSFGQYRSAILKLC